MGHTNKDLTINFKCCGWDYGELTIPKGTSTSHNTACGLDKSYNFINSFQWAKDLYPTFSTTLIMDLSTYGYNVPKEHVDCDCGCKKEKI